MMLFDPQRNLLTTLLAGALGVLGVLALIVLLLMGRPNVERIAAAPGPGPVLIDARLAASGLADAEYYGVIVERPLFFENRRLPPTAQLADSGDEEDEIEEVVIEVAGDLKAKLAGVVITPEVRLAMIADAAAQKTLLLREGMALEGDQAAWRIEEIRPRHVTFVADGGRRASLELTVETRALAAGQAPPPRTPAEPRQGEVRDAQTEPDEEARARAEEVRRRVAERRAQLRAEAERRARENQP